MIDVGINVDADGNLCGDVDYDTMKTVASAHPVPGGLGAVTTAVLAKHAVKATITAIQLLQKPGE